MYRPYGEHATLYNIKLSSYLRAHTEAALRSWKTRGLAGEMQDMHEFGAREQGDPRARVHWHTAHAHLDTACAH